MQIIRNYSLPLGTAQRGKFNYPQRVGVKFAHPAAMDTGLTLGKHA